MHLRKIAPHVIPHRLSRLAAVVVASTVTMCVVACSAVAGPIQAEMTWNSVTGTYGGLAVSNEPMTLKFSYDTADVVPSSISGFFQVNFANGAGVYVTLGTGGSILNDVPLDNVSGNGSAMLASSNIFFGYLEGATYKNDRGFLGGITSAPNASSDMLTTAWSSSASNAGISTGFGAASNPLTINGQQLALSSAFGGVGAWQSTAVPEPSTLTLLGLAGAGGLLALRRRRRAT